MREGKEAWSKSLCRKGGAKPETLTAALAGAMDDKEKAAIAEMLKKAGAKPPLEVDAATLQSYVGKYKPEQGNEITFSLKDGKLIASAGQSAADRDDGARQNNVSTGRV